MITIYENPSIAFDVEVEDVMTKKLEELSIKVISRFLKTVTVHEHIYGTRDNINKLIEFVDGMDINATIEF